MAQPLTGRIDSECEQFRFIQNHTRERKTRPMPNKMHLGIGQLCLELGPRCGARSLSRLCLSVSFGPGH